MIKIGQTVIKNNVFLAPMAGITDRSFRTLCKEQGCGMSYTEMVSAKGLSYHSKNTQALLSTAPFERPIGVQLFGSDEKILAGMAEILSEYPIDLIDLNMGCPAAKIVKNGEGSALMKNPHQIGAIIKAVSEKSKLPVTVKIRKGYDANQINAVEVARIAEASGAMAITVHGRTKEQYYSGQADWDIIRKVKESVKIPVIGNGDVIDPLTAKKMLDTTGCDGIMIGRGAQGNPWIFQQITTYLEQGILIPLPTMTEKMQMALRHGKMLEAHKGEYIGMREMRKHMGWYLKGAANASSLRVKLNSICTYGELEQLIKEHFLQ